LVGQTVRGRFSTHRIHELEIFFDHAKKCQHPDLRKWERRALEVIEDPEKFDNDDWFAGKLAGYSFP
jgi:hypothetical protein